jgi:molybdenum cofactor guanylyltransferase
MTIDAIVLAGGGSARFGTDKLVAQLDGRPLLHHALESCAAVAGRIVVVIAPGGPVPDLPPALAHRIVVVRDAAPHGGPLAGLATGLEAIDGSDVALVAGGDMPSLVPAVLRLLSVHLVTNPALAVVTLEADPISPLPIAVRPAVALPQARALLAADRRSLHGLLDRLRASIIPAATWRALDPEGRTLSDVDTPADLVPKKAAERPSEGRD